MTGIKNFKSVFWTVLFGLWTFGITFFYFYFYKQYTDALFHGVYFLLSLGIIFSIGAFFVVCFRLLLEIFGKPLPRLFRLKIPEVKKISLRSVIFTFYGVAIFWIFCIFWGSRWNFGIFLTDIFSLIFLSFFVVAGFSLGSILIRHFQIKTSGLLERYILASLFGFGVIMFLMYVLGMVGLLYSWIAYTILFGILFFFRKEWFQFFDEVGGVSFQWKIRPFFSFRNFSRLAVFFLFSLSLTGMFSQFPVGFDELHTYQAFPKVYVENHRIVNFPYWFASGFPQNGEMLFTFGHLLGGFTLSAGINVIFYFLLGGILVLFFHFLFVRSEDFYNILLLYVVMPISYHMTLDHKIDLIFWSYAMCGIYFLLKFIEEKKKGLMILSFILLGISAGVKYNFLSLVLLSILFVLIFFPRDFSFKKRFFNSIMCIFFVGLLFSPWALKNIIFSGNPIEPAFGDYLSRDDVFFKQIGRSYSDHLEEHFSDAKVWAENQDIRDWKFYATLPFRLTFNYKKENFYDIINITPIFLIAIPLLFLFFRKKYYFSKNDTIFIVIFFIIFVQLISWIFLSSLLFWYSFITLLLLLVIIGYQMGQKNNFSFLFQISLFILVFPTLLIRINYFLPNGSFFTLENNGNYDLFEVAQFINKENLSGLIWDSFGVSLNYYVQNAHSKIIYDYYQHIFLFLSQMYKEDSSVDFMKLHNVHYFIYKEKDINYYQKVIKRSKDVSPVSSELYLQSFEEYLRFRKKYLKEIFRSGDIILYTYKD